MSQAGGVPLAAWVGYWRIMRRYHRYEVTGLQHIVESRPALIVGYHGRPIAHDMCMLTVTLYERLGYMPHAIVHAAAGKQAILRWVTEGLGFVTGGEGVKSAAARGEHSVVTPGGTREGCRSFRDRYRVSWGGRMGYLRLALENGLPIIPVAAAGVDDAYIGLNDGYALGKRIGAPLGLPVWLGLGICGPWPLSPPLPVKIRQVIGPPIDLQARGRVDPRDREGLAALHGEVTGAIQALLDAARAGDSARASDSARAASE